MSTMPVRCGAMLLGVLLAGGPVRAQVEDPVEQARELFEEGNAAARAQEYDRALELFHRSYLLNPNPTVTFNIGLCYQKMGDAPAAVQAFVDYLAEGGDALPEERRSRTQELIDGLAPQVGAVRILVEEPGAEIFVDGESVGPSPLDEVVYVSPGAHALEGRWPDTEAVERPVDVLAGITTPLYVRMEKPEAFLDELEPSTPPVEGPAPVPEWAFWTAVGATGAFGLTAILTLTFAELTYDDYVSGGRRPEDSALAARGEALDVTTWVMAGLFGAALVAGTVLFFYTDFGGESAETPPESGPEVALLPGSLVLRW